MYICHLIEVYYEYLSYFKYNGEILYKYVCDDTNFGNLLANLINMFFCEVPMRTNSQTITISAAAIFLAFAMIATPSLVLAASPHFIGTPTCTTSSSGGTKTLTCSGKIAGLGNVSTVSAQLISDITTQCTNRGQNVPPGHSSVTGTPTTLQVSNGQTVFTLSVTASANCPPPQVGSVTFNNVRVAVEGTVLAIPGTF